MKYGEWLTEWLNNYVKISAKHRTIERYSEIINIHLIPAVGELELQEITPMIAAIYCAVKAFSSSLVTSNSSLVKRLYLNSLPLGSVSS